MLDIAIVGGGPAGLAAGIKAATEGLSAAVFEKSHRVGGRPASSPLIENIPGYDRGISGPVYAETLARQAQRFGCRVHTDAGVVGLERTSDGFILDVYGRNAVEARSVLLALGLAEARIPGLGDFCRYSCDPNQLRAHAGEIVVFVGGGNSSVMLALEVAEAGADEVTIVARQPLVSNVSAYLLPRVDRAGIKVVLGEVTEAGPSGDDPPIALRVPGAGWNGWLFADAVYAFPGGVAAVPSWFTGELDADGKILTGDAFEPDADVWFSLDDARDGAERWPFNYETSIPGVFACGDIRSGNGGAIAAAVGEGTQAVQSIFKQYLPTVSLPGGVRPLARN